MTVGNFTELIGTNEGGIFGFDSISGSDLQIVYALDESDVLNSTVTFAGGGLPEGGATTILVGGSGGDSYQIRNGSTAIVIEQSNLTSNILWTTIGNSSTNPAGISLESGSSFVAEIENRHLYLGNTESDQYVILIDWQVPENQIETFNLSEGDLSYEEFAASFRQSSNYRGNLTWSELAATGEIDFERLGLSPETIDSDIATINARATELELGSNDTGLEPDNSEVDQEGMLLVGTFDDELLVGGEGNDFLTALGRDTLEGGLGDDFYSLDFSSGGSQIVDAGGEVDDLVIFTSNTDFEALATGFESEEVRTNPATFPDSAIELSLPSAGIIGLQQSDTDLIIDLNSDGVIQTEEDVTILDFFDANGELGTGAIESITNIVDTQSIVDFFATNSEVNNITGSTVYRFFNNQTGVHFYTANEIERDAVEGLANFSFEGASYTGADPLTGVPEPLPVYRFLNQDTGVHLYTISEIERDAVEELDNFSFEGEAFFAYETQVDGSIPIYRFYNSTSGAHFYTPSTEERDNVEANLPDFQSEGIAYYAFPQTE